MAITHLTLFTWPIPQMAVRIGQIVRLWLQPPHEPMRRTAMELREALISRLTQGEKLSLTDAEVARVTRREVRAATFIDAAFGARICPAPSLPPSAQEPSRPPVSPLSPPLQLRPPPPPSVPPAPHATARVRVQLFDSFGDGWDGVQLVVSPLSGAAPEESFTLSPGLSSTTASLSLPLGCHQLRMMHQGGDPLTSTSTRDVAEASWRFLDCPAGASSSVHLAHEVAEACVTMEESAAETRCRLLEAPMLVPPPPPSPDIPPREHPLPPLLPLPSLPPSVTPGTPPSPPSPPSLPIPSVTPVAPLSPGPQEPPPLHVSEPSPPLSPTMLLPPAQQAPPFPPFVPSVAPVPPSPSLPLSPVYPPQLGVSSPLPPHLPPPKPARPPSAPQSANGDDTTGGLDADDTTGGLDADHTIGGLDANTLMARLLVGVIGSAVAVFFCATCFDARRKGRRAHAYARRMAEHNAPINQSFVCGNSQTTAAQWLEHGDRNAQPRRQSDAQLERYRQQMISPEGDRQLGPQRIVGRIASETAHEEPRSRKNPARPISPGVRSRSKQRLAVGSFNVDSAGTSEEHAGLPTTMPLFGWNRVTLSGPPSLSKAARRPTTGGTSSKSSTTMPTASPRRR